METGKNGSVVFKGKIRDMHNVNGTLSYRYIPIKKTISKADYIHPAGTNRHAGYYNSNLFISMIKRGMLEVIGTAEKIKMEQLPAGVSVDTSGFLAEVNICLPDSFSKYIKA